MRKNLNFLQISFKDLFPITKPSDPGPAVLSDVPPMGSFQFSVGEVEQALLNLDANKGPGSDKSPTDDSRLAFSLKNENSFSRGLL
jgi:hypothetical protein